MKLGGYIMIISYPVKFTLIKEEANKLIYEIDLLDFNQKKIIETKSDADLHDQTTKFLFDEGQKLEAIGKLPPPSKRGVELTEKSFISNILYKMDFDDK